MFWPCNILICIIDKWLHVQFYINTIGYKHIFLWNISPFSYRFALWLWFLWFITILLILIKNKFIRIVWYGTISQNTVATWRLSTANPFFMRFFLYLSFLFSSVVSIYYGLFFILFCTVTFKTKLPLPWSHGPLSLLDVGAERHLHRTGWLIHNPQVFGMSVCQHKKCVKLYHILWRRKQTAIGNTSHYPGLVSSHWCCTL